jgi:DNA-binding NarL/FixJ family response regulator
MTTNNVHVLAGGRRVSQLLVADRNQGECEIAVRAIKRLPPHLEVRPVTNLAEAENARAQQAVVTVFVASGLDDRTHEETIRWFLCNAPETIIIALLERCDDRAKQEALEAGASYICSKPDLLVAQLRREAAKRLPNHATQLAVYGAKDPRSRRAGQHPLLTPMTGHHR